MCSTKVAEVAWYQCFKGFPSMLATGLGFLVPTGKGAPEVKKDTEQVWIAKSGEHSPENKQDG